MKSKEEMIETIAGAIYHEYYPNGYTGSKNYNDTPELHKANLRRNAEAALKALCEALPELTKKPKFSGFIDGLVMTDAPKLYNQLKQWGK